MDKQKIREVLAGQPEGFPATIAQQLGVSEWAVVKELPAEAMRQAPVAAFDEIMAELTHWGEITFLVRNGSVVAEIKTSVPPGRHGERYFNLEHGVAPLGGHIGAKNLAAICFVEKQSRGNETLSIQFFDRQGDNMFKIYLSRTADKKIVPEQKEAYYKLRKRLTDDK